MSLNLFDLNNDNSFSDLQHESKRLKYSIQVVDNENLQQIITSFHLRKLKI